MTSYPRVMFVHGLESGPSGEKVQQLRAMGVGVSAADMRMSLKRLDRHHSVMRNILRAPEVQVAAAGAAAMVGAGFLRKKMWPVALAGVGIGAWWTARGEEVTRQAVCTSYEQCVEVQRRALATFKPDVLLGSSWGGAITLELMLRGHWRGPAVLLAPAFHAAHRRMGLDASARLEGFDGASRTLIFHDPTDDTVPLADSERLSAQTGTELRAVSAGGHRLMGLLTDGQLAGALKQVGELEQVAG